MNSVDKGNLGMISISKALTMQGYEVFLPLSENSSCDLVAIKDQVMYRVECKSTSFSASAVSWGVALRQIRPNRTGNVVKKFDSAKSDLLAVYIVPEDRVEIFNSIDYHDRTTVTIKKHGYANSIGEGTTLEK